MGSIRSPTTSWPSAADRVRLSLAGAADHRRLADEHAAGWTFDVHPERAASTPSCPSLSLVLVGIGGWFIGMRSLVSNIVTEDYVTYAELARREPPAHPASYVMRNALVPQVTGLAMSLGIDLQRRHHHRAGVRLSRPRHAADSRRLCRRLQPGARHHLVSIIAVVGLRAC